MIVRYFCKEGKVGLLAQNLEKIGKESKYPHKRKRGDFDKQWLCETWTKMCQIETFCAKLEENDEWCDKPGLHGDPCGGRGRESREGRSYSPSNTCCIHSCENQHVTCIEQRSSLWAVASTMVATYCPHHQDLQHPVENNQNQKLYFNHPPNKNKTKRQNPNASTKKKKN